MLKQPQNSPIPVEKQVVIIFAVINKYLIDVPTDLVAAFQDELFEYLDGNHGDILDTIRETKTIDGVKDALSQAIAEFKNKFLSEH